MPGWPRARRKQRGPKPIRPRRIRPRPIRPNSRKHSSVAGGSADFKSNRTSFRAEAIALARGLRNTSAWECAGREMRKDDAGFDFHRYRRLLAEAVDDDKRMALIDLLIEERAKERLDAQRASDRAAMTASTIATILRSSRA